MIFVSLVFNGHVSVYISLNGTSYTNDCTLVVQESLSWALVTWESPYLTLPSDYHLSLAQMWPLHI